MKDGDHPENGTRETLSRLILRAERLLAAAADRAALLYRPECTAIAERTETLAGALREIALVESTYVYERPIRGILPGAERALSLATVCLTGSSIILRQFKAALAGASDALDHSIEEITWLLKMLTMPTPRSRAGNRFRMIPAPTRIDGVLSWVWAAVVALHIGTQTERGDGARALAVHSVMPDYLAHIIEEDAVPALVCLLEEGTAEDRNSAAFALCYISHQERGVESVLQAGGLGAILQALEKPPMRAQASAIHAFSMMVFTKPSLREHLALDTLVNLFIGILQEHSHCHYINVDTKDRESSMKLELMVSATLALWRLTTGSESICKLVVGSGALPVFAALLDRGAGGLSCYSGMLLTEIASVAEHSLTLQHAAFMPTSPQWRVVLEQLLKVVQCGHIKDNLLLLPCINALGCLAGTFTEEDYYRVIPALVNLLVGWTHIAREAATALSKLVCSHHVAVRKRQGREPLVEMGARKKAKAAREERATYIILPLGNFFP